MVLVKLLIYYSISAKKQSIEIFSVQNSKLMTKKQKTHYSSSE
jgi:hypothetical protein